MTSREGEAERGKSRSVYDVSRWSGFQGRSEDSPAAMVIPGRTVLLRKREEPQARQQVDTTGSRPPAETSIGPSSQGSVEISTTYGTPGDAPAPLAISSPSTSPEDALREHSSQQASLHDDLTQYPVSAAVRKDPEFSGKTPIFKKKHLDDPPTRHVTFTSPPISSQDFVVVDMPRAVQVFPHPLFDCVAVMTSNSLFLVHLQKLELIQRLVDPLALPAEIGATRVHLPFRLHDSATLFVPNAAYHLNDGASERLLIAAWHRESLTLAVGATHAFMIFAGQCQNQHITFACARFVPVVAPCTFIVWLSDALLTKSCPQTGASDGHHTSGTVSSHSPPLPPGNSVPLSLFFVWSCQFQRYTRPRLTSGGLDKLTQITLSCSPTLRECWDHENSPLAEFMWCSDAPLFCWRALAGFNARPIPPVPIPFQPFQLVSAERDQITVQVRRISAHPGGRFVAALYAISVIPARSKSSECTAVPSPVVRLWSLRPSFGVSTAPPVEDHASSSQMSCTEPPGNPQRKKRFLNLGAKGASSKGRSCFLSGVAGLFHLGKHRQRSDQARGGSVGAPEAELQGPEWLIIDQLHRMSSESLAWTGTDAPSAPSIMDHRRALMALMASRGLVSDTDLATVCAATQSFRPHAESDSVPAVKQKMTSVPDDLALAAIPAVVDGPYYCCSLNHKAPVLELSWHDDGPILDEVFVPSVLCSLTVDNCLTVWIESQAETYLWFEAAILLRLEVSPIRNFFHPMDVLPCRARTLLSSTSMRGPAGQFEGRKFSIPASASRGVTFSAVDMLNQVGLATTAFDEPSVTFCWLTNHRVALNGRFQGNMLRLMKTEAKTRLVGLEIFEEPSAGYGAVRPASFSAAERNMLDRYTDGGTLETASDTDVQRHEERDVSALSLESGILPFRTCGHLSDPTHTVVPGVKPSATTSVENVVPATLLPLPALPSQPLPTLAAVTHRQHSIDFLLVAESFRGTHAGLLLNTSTMPGLWVYTLRELGSQPRGNPAVKRLLKPRQVPLPCRIRTLVSAESLKSLGLSDAVWGDGCATVTGEPVIVRDGILLPSCVVTAILSSGEVVTCLVRPRAIPPDATGERRPGDSFVVVYESRVERCLGPHLPLFHILKTPSLRDAVLRSPSKEVETSHASLLSETPTPSHTIGPGVGYRGGSSTIAMPEGRNRDPSVIAAVSSTLLHPSRSIICRLKTPCWIILEEHPLLSSQLLALNNRGWLFVGNLADMVRRFYQLSAYNDGVILQEHRERDCSAMFIPSAGSVSPMMSFTDDEESDSYSASLSDERHRTSVSCDPSTRVSLGAGGAASPSGTAVPPGNYERPHVKALSDSAFCCIHSFGGPWLEKGVRVWASRDQRLGDLRVATTLPLGYRAETSLSSDVETLPPLRHALWLPLAGRPPLVLGVTERGGYLLCLEIAHSSGMPTVVRGIPFLGSYCGSLLDVQYLLTAEDTFDENCRDHRAVVSSVQAVPRSDDECLLLVRVTLETVNDSACPPLREEHVVLLRCREIHDPQLDTRQALQLSILYEGFLDFSKNHIGLHGNTTEDAKTPTMPPMASTKLSSNQPTEVSYVVPQLALVSTSTEGIILGLMATYPPLDGADASPKMIFQTPPQVSGCNIVGLYEALEGNILHVYGWALVPARKRGIDRTYDDPIVALALSQEWLAVLTSHAELHLFSLLDAPPLPALSSFHSMLAWTGCALGLTTEVPRAQTTPIFSPTKTFSFRSSLDVLQSDLVRRRRRVMQHIDETFEHFRHDVTVNVDDQAHPNMRYFKPTNSLFDDKLQLDTTRRRSQRNSFSVDTAPPSLKGEGTSRVKRLDRERPLLLKPHQLGQSPPMSFRRTRGDGLGILLTLYPEAQLDTTGVMTSDDAAVEQELRVVTMTECTELELPPHVITTLLLRVRKEGVESWWRPNQPLMVCNHDVFVTSSVWSSRFDQLLVATSVASRCLTDVSLPPMVYRLPQTVRALVRAVSAPRPVYHPSSLAAVSIRLEDISLVLKILKRLLESLTLWRKCGRPIPPTVDLPIAFLCSKPIGWVQFHRRDVGAFRMRLLELLTETASTSYNITTKALNTVDDVDMLTSKTAKSPPTPGTGITWADSTENGGHKAIRETAAALFANDNDDDSFSFTLDDDDDSRNNNKASKDTRNQLHLPSGTSRQRRESEQHDKPSVGRPSSHTTPLEEPVFRNEAESTIVELKSFRETFGELGSMEIQDATPLPEATKDDLLQLISLLDITSSENYTWLCAHTTLCPHLSLTEVAQLSGFTRMLIRLYDPYQSARASQKRNSESFLFPAPTPLLYAVWGGGSEDALKKDAVDVAGSKFLYSYYHTLAVTDSHIALTKVVADYIAAGQNGSDRQGESVEGGMDAAAGNRITDWSVLFPGGLSSISSLAGDATYLEPIGTTAFAQEELLRSGSHYSRFSVTTSDLCWAVHCQSDDVLLDHVLSFWKELASREGDAKLSWAVLRQAGVGFWLRNPIVAMRLASEDLPRDIYASQPSERKNPDTVALWYIVTNRLPVLRALYKTAKNQKVVEFLSRDFNDEKTRLAAAKNAYLLIRQRRYELAVAFFLLSRSYSEAIDVCCGQLDDPQLALFIALILEYQTRISPAHDIDNKKDRDAILRLRKFVLFQKVLPTAIQARDRWLVSLIFWLLGHYDQAVVATLPPELRSFLGTETMPLTPPISPATDHGVRPGVTADPFTHSGPKHTATLSTPADTARDGEVDTAIQRVLSLDSFGTQQHHISVPRSATPGVLEGGGVSFGCGSIRYSSPNPSLPLFRKYLFNTLQVRRSLQGGSAISDFFCVMDSFKKALREKSDSLGADAAVENTKDKRLTSAASSSSWEQVTLYDKDGHTLEIRPHVVAIMAILCEGLLNLVDIGESLLYCLAHRFPFQGLQLLNDFKTLMEALQSDATCDHLTNVSTAKSSTDRHTSLVRNLGSAIQNANTRLRWVCAVGFARHACDALGYLTAVNLKKTEADIEWMENLFQDTVETFQTTSDGRTGLRLASATWRTVIGAHGGEHYHRGESLTQWILRQLEGPVEFRVFTVGLPRFESSSSSDAVQTAPTMYASTQRDQHHHHHHHYYERHNPLAVLRHDKQRVVDAFHEALRGLPAWSFLSEQQDWTERVIFNGISTATLGVVSCLEAMVQTTHEGVTTQSMAAKALVLQAATRVAIAWCLRPSAHAQQYKPLLSLALTACCCVASAGAFLVVNQIMHVSSVLMCPLLTPITRPADDNIVTEDPVVRQSRFWEQWPINVDPPHLWSALSLLIRHMDHLEIVYSDLAAGGGGNGAADDGSVSASALPSSLDDDNVMDQLLAELVSFNEFLLNGLLVPRTDYIARVEESLGNSQHPPQAPGYSVAGSTTEGDTTSRQPLAFSWTGNMLQKLAGAHLTAGSDQLAQFLTMRQETAKEAVLESLLGSDYARDLMRTLMFGALTTSIKARLLNSMAIALEASHWLLASEKHRRDACVLTARHILDCLRSLASKFRTHVYGALATEYYQTLIASVAVTFPFFPMALCVSARVDPPLRSSDVDDPGIHEADHTLAQFAAASGCEGADTPGYRTLWSNLGCSRKIQLLLARGPLSAVPSSLALGMLAPDQLPFFSRLIACVKDAPISIAMDRSGGLTHIHQIPLVGSPSLPGYPLGLGLFMDFADSIGLSGLGILNLSTSQCVWEINVGQSVIFNRNFGVATASGPGLIAALSSCGTGGTGATDSMPQRPESAVSQGSSGRPATPFHLLTAQCLHAPLTYDDDEAVPSTNMATCRIRFYDEASGTYERHLAEQVALVFLSRGLLHRTSENKHKQLPRHRLQEAPSASETGKHTSPEHEKRRSFRGRPLWSNSPGDHVTRPSIILRLHASRFHRRHTPVRATVNSEGTIATFDTTVEFFLRGFLNAVADVPTTRIESVGGHGASESRLSFLEEEIPLVATGLSLLPLPQATPLTQQLHKSPPSSTGTTGSQPSGATTSSALSLRSTVSVAERSAYSWLRLVSVLQQKLARNLLVELQLSCLPPLVSPGSNQPAKTMTLLEPHPVLPICAGVIADSQVVHTAHASLIVALWKIGEPHVKAVGTLGLWPSHRPSVHAQHTTSASSASHSHFDATRPVTASTAEGHTKTEASARDGHNSTIGGGNGLPAKPSTASAVTRRSVGTTSSSGSSPTCPVSEISLSTTVTHAEAGPIKELAWNAAGDRLVAAYNRGWVSIWALRTERSSRLVHSTSRAPNTVLHMGSNAAMNPSGSQGTPSVPSVGSGTTSGLPIAVFKPHMTSCRFAAFLSACPGADSLLVTSGRGLSPTPVVFPHSLPQNHLLFHHQHHHHHHTQNQLLGSSPSSTADMSGSSVVSCASDEGCVCIWDLGGRDRLGPPALLMVDLNFDRNNYATHYAVWRARQCVLYCTRRGEIRLMSLRHPGKISTVVNPVVANALRAQARKQQLGATPGGYKTLGDVDTGTAAAAPSAGSAGQVTIAGSFGREIVKMFLLEQSQRLVTCYEDAMIRVWDVSKLCTATFAHTGHLAKPISSTTSSYRPRGAVPWDEPTTDHGPRERWDCVPLLWETPVPVHSHDTSKLSLAASLMGAVFNIAPSGGSPRCLLDAQMASPYHVLTLGADGTIVMTRI